MSFGEAVFSAIGLGVTLWQAVIGHHSWKLARRLECLQRNENEERSRNDAQG